MTMKNFFDLAKYAHTGIASPGMTAYDKARARAMTGGGFPISTIEGVPPISFLSNGTPLISLSMLGNGQQTGTPSPYDIIMPTFCGVRTANLWNEDYTGISTSLKYVPVYVGNADVTMSTTCQRTSSGASIFLLSGNVSSGAATNTNGVWAKTGSYVETSRTASPIDGYVTVAFRTMTESGTEYNPANAETMLNLGSTALPYEPYGWAEKITCAGQTVPVYLGTVQTVRRIKKLVLTGEENWSSYSGVVYLSNIIDYLKTEAAVAICTHYQPQSSVEGVSETIAGHIAFSKGANFRLCIRDSSHTSGADFKTYLASEYAAGHPVTIWYVLATPETAIVNEPLCKIGDYADELSSADAGVTIPTAKGENVLTFDTAIQPSKVSITGSIKQ